MNELLNKFENGIPFEVTLENNSVMKLVGVMIVATIMVVIVGNVIQKTFFNKG